MRNAFRSAGPRLAATLGCLFLILFSVASVIAAELPIRTVISGDTDIARAVISAEGSIAILGEGRIDLARPGGEIASLGRSAQGEALFLSDAGAYVGSARYREGAADFAPTASFELRDAAGRILWRTGETEDVTYSISKNGDVVGMMLNINVPERNALHFYDRNGAIVAEVAVPYLETGRFDPNGALYLAQSARDGLRAFEGSTGREIWSVPDVRLFAATDDARRIAVVGGTTLRIIRDGAVAASVPTNGLLVRRVAIAPDGSRIAIAGKHEIRLYDESGSALASIMTGDDALSWTSVDVAASGGWLMAGVARDLGPAAGDLRRHPDGEVRAYDASGALVHKAALTFPIWNIWTPTVAIDRSGKAATITTRRAVYRTVLP